MVNDSVLFDIFIVLLSAQIVRVYLEALQTSKKKKSAIGWMIWGVYVLFQYYVMRASTSQPLLILIINIVLIFLLYKVLYCVNWKTALFQASILCVIWMLIEVATSNILSLTGIEEYSYFFVVGSAVSKIVMYIMLHLLKHCRKSNSFLNVPFSYWLRIFLIPIATIYIINNTYWLTMESNDKTFFTITAILMILVNYITFDVYDMLGSHMEAEKKNVVYEQQIALCNKQAAEREAAYQATRMIRHDLNGYLIDLKATLQSGRLAEAEMKIDEILKNNQLYSNEVSHSGNLVIDSLINYKDSLAKTEEIDLRCDIVVPEQLPYEGSDLCIILGNLIDNAMEAVEKLPSELRYIHISVVQRKGNLGISIRNPYRGNIRMNNGGQILTSKQDKKNHGLGILSVQRTVDKYNGECIIRPKNGIFEVMILLYPQEMR